MAVAEWTEPLVRRLIEENGGGDPREIIRDYADNHGWALATAMLSDPPVYHAHTTDKGA